MFRGSWVRIPTPYTGRTFFTFIYCTNCKRLFEKKRINEKEAGDDPFLRRMATESHVIEQSWSKSMTLTIHIYR